MKIVFHKNFERNFKKLSPKLREKASLAIEKFSRNPLNPVLKNHALTGKLSGRRAISFGGDARIVFEEFDGYILVIILDIGTHNQVYR